MPAPKGNQFWKARTKHGRDKIFKSADVLWKACQEYFEWNEKNPLIEYKPFAYQGEVTQEPVPRMRAMTISGLCLFLDVDRKTWDHWRADEDFFPVVTRAEQIIYNQKFQGASADMLNANIIARDLGLVDKKETKHDGSIAVGEMTEEQINNRIAQLIGNESATES